MSVDEQGAGGESLTAEEYRMLRRSTETHREELVVRLAAEVGLRPAEIVSVRPADVQPAGQDSEGFLLAVPDPAADATIDRYAYLPADVEHDLRQYVRTAGIDDDERIVSVTPRRVQMLVSAVADRAADRTGRAALAGVSSRTLRQYFARRLLADEQLHPSVVQAVGGWESLASLEPYLDEPDREEIVAAFENRKYRETTARPAADTDPPRRTVGDSDRQPVSEEHSDRRPVGEERGGRLGGVLDRLLAVGTALDAASTREEIERRVVEALADGDTYRFAWLADVADGDLDVHARAGIEQARLEPMLTGDGATATAHRSGDVVATTAIDTDDTFENWRADASDHGYSGAAAVPVIDGDTRYGVLHVGVDDEAAMDDRERALLADLGRRLGGAITAAEQRKLLLADTVVELTFQASAPDSFFATLSAEHDCALELEGVVPGEEGSLLYFLTVTDAQPGDVLDWATDREAVGDVRLIRDHGDRSLVEIVLTGGDCSTALVERGATIGELTASGGSQRVVSAVPTRTDVRALVDALTDAVPGTELVGKREREQAAETATAFRSSLQDALTEKQSAVLQAAYHAGYFEWPRGSTAEELADAIGITSPTLHNHLRRAQQKLLESFYEDAHQHPREESPWNES